MEGPESGNIKLLDDIPSYNTIPFLHCCGTMASLRSIKRTAMLGLPADVQAVAERHARGFRRPDLDHHVIAGGSRQPDH